MLIATSRVVDDVGAAHWSANVSLQEMVEVWISEQHGNLFGDVGPDLRLAVCDFLDDLLPPVDQKQNVLGIAAGDEIALAASAVCLQLGRDKQLRLGMPLATAVLESRPQSRDSGQARIDPAHHNCVFQAIVSTDFTAS
ncbi:hypothetical protein [Mesorhizobium sp. M0134]|uniref:hypothetical protein n=1 Tax=Mesorhizobium sp. M0134 TaxID=2956889 RepID=UPI0033389CF5